MTRRGTGAQIRYRVDFGRAAMSDAGIEALYGSLSRDLLAATGSPTLEWDGQVAFAERLLAQYQTEGRDLGLYTENTFGVELTPHMEHLGFISRERIVVRGEQLAANLTTPAAVLADAHPVITVRPKDDWLAEYRWTDSDRARIAAGERDVPLLVTAHETDPVVQACLVPPSSPEYSALIASHGSQVTVAVSARYFAPALTERYPLTPESTVMRLLAETGEHSGRQVVVLDIELNIIVALWAFLEHRMLVGRIPLEGIAAGGGELTAFVARRDDGDLPFLGVCRTDRCVQLVNDLPLLAAGSFTARAADAIVDVAWASQIAGHIIGSRSFVGMSPVEETPL